MSDAPDDLRTPLPELNSDSSRESSLRGAERWITPGAVATSVGIILCFTEARDFGGLVTVCGLAACLIGLHRYGRSGAKSGSIVATKHSDPDVAP